MVVANLDQLRASGALKTALKTALEARTRYPDALDIHVRYQDICRSLGKEAEVREEYRRRWSATKTIESVCLYARLLKGKAAIREYKAAVKKRPDYFYARYGLGVAYLHSGNVAAAKHELNVAHSLRPALAAPKIRLGQIAEHEGDFKRALDYYRLAEKVGARHPDPIFHQVFALLALDRLADAEKVAQRLLLHPAADAVSLGSIALGVLRNAQGDRAAAAKCFDGAVRHSVRYGSHALTFLGDALVDLRRFDEAETAYGNALARQPENVRARMGLAYLFYRKGDFKQADAEFATAAKSTAEEPRNSAHALFFRGVIAEEEGRLTHALGFYLKAIDRDAEVAEYRLALAVLYERMRQPSKALKAYEQAALLDQTDALASLQAGLLHAEAKRGRRALEHLRETIKRDPTLTDAYLAAGSVCQDLLKRPRDAKAWYRRYLRAGGNDERVKDWLKELE